MNARRTLILLAAALLCLGCRGSCNPHFSSRFAREEALRHDLFEMRKAIADYHVDQKRFPESLEELSGKKYLMGIPRDPITMEKTWVPVRKGASMVEVRSGASGKACDGTFYRDW